MTPYAAIYRAGVAGLLGAGCLLAFEQQAQAEHHSKVTNIEEHLPRLRPVLKGVLYRSGSPSEPALQQMCETGWKRVYSLYGEHTTHLGPRNSNMLRHGRDTRTCQGEQGPRVLEWRPAPSSRMRNLPALFADILDSIRNPEKGPLLVHCWNGLHYAGMVSALALRQFCGLSAEDAEAYWRANANRGANYPLIIANFYQFKPIAGLQLTPEEQAAVCPDMSKGYMVAGDQLTGGLMMAKFALSDRAPATVPPLRSGGQSDKSEPKDMGLEPGRRSTGFVPPQPAPLEPSGGVVPAAVSSPPTAGAQSANLPRTVVPKDTAHVARPAKG